MERIFQKFGSYKSYQKHSRITHFKDDNTVQFDELVENKKAIIL